MAGPGQAGQARPVQPYADPDREVMIPVEGGRVYVRINGDLASDAIPAIFLHGGPGGIHNGFAAMLGLASDRPVIMYDQLDSGRSDRPNDPANWRVERFVDTLETIRQTLGVDRWHIVGMSWGSAIALEYTARYSQHSASTVLGGTFISTPHWITDANLLIADLPEEMHPVLEACESDDPPSPEQCIAVFTMLYSRYYERVPSSEAARAYAARVGGNGPNPVIYRGMWGPSEFSSTGTLRTYDATHLLRDVDGTRILFLIGQYDSARIDTVQDFVRLAPGAELAVVPGGSHGFMSDRPLETEAILSGWLARNDIP
ncbi:proline iminopeptidase-family hydrolase [Parasphingopyxis sp.]|uniref:proline iminopeptidase-family hydrolase n=1 Tax=Parasphingopyxis sp. TaxID=1920299 RepID=UPI00260B880A|nr:proline iminopeptidase-family hydrolase [Parasphingopyxis sp.]